jgi:RimJ/RimL family protein N-acetyltransferase
MAEALVIPGGASRSMSFSPRPIGRTNKAVIGGTMNEVPDGGRPCDETDRGATRLAAPLRRLADDRIELRLPEWADAETLYSYASRNGGIHGIWAPLAGGANLTDCRALVADWLRGWRGEHSHHGPALIVAAAGDPALLGQVGFGDRGDRVVEIVYGIAPDHRRRGYATSAARLTAHWLLQDQDAELVELRIGASHAISQRVALAAGFAPAGKVRSRLPATGAIYEDQRFVLRR